jgi:hypothetical protein
MQLVPFNTFLEGLGLGLLQAAALTIPFKTFLLVCPNLDSKSS